MSPTVSVVVPVHNAEDTVSLAIASVLGQTYSDFEMILVDDGSTDRSAAVCEMFHDDRVRLIRQPNRGLAAARNTGIRNARGRYVAMLDADDIFLPEKLGRHVAHFESTPYLGISFSHSELIDGEGRLSGKVQCAPSGAYSLAELILENPVGNGSAAVILRKALQAVSFREKRHGKLETMYFDEGLAAAEDLDLFWRIADRSPWGVACLPVVLTQYRRTRTSMSADTGRMLRGWGQAIDKAGVYAPTTVAEVENEARARFLRYLAGRAVAAGDGVSAWHHMQEAMRHHPGILRTHPRSAFLTLAAAGILRASGSRRRPPEQAAG